jgi:GNAT superfamily N-acetyltransferase
MLGQAPSGKPAPTSARIRDEEIPATGIAVVGGYRERGIGRVLMDRIAHQARLAKIERVALGVNTDNRAKRLYLAMGYIEYEPPHRDERTVLDLESTSGSGLSNRADLVFDVAMCYK